MSVAFVGDVHGCARHALAALVALQATRQIAFDAVVQVGDLGAHHDTERFLPSDHRYRAENPAQGDMLRVANAEGVLLAELRRARRALGGRPVLFVSGNHEDDDWLASLHANADGAPVVPIDPAGVFQHVASGTVLTTPAGVRLAFLGGCAAPGFSFDIPNDALEDLLGVEPGSVDVLVTHDGPFGIARNWRGDVQGSRRITRLIDQLRPRYHVSGHYHHVNGPRTYGPTTSYQLANLVDAKADRWERKPPNPDQRVMPGSIGLLDPDVGTFEYVADAWLAEIGGDDLDLGAHLDRWGPVTGGQRG